MSDNTKPAFPRSGPGGDEGMSLRDYFAAHTLARLSEMFSPEIVAEAAYKIADALLAEREKL